MGYYSKCTMPGRQAVLTVQWGSRKSLLWPKGLETPVTQVCLHFDPVMVRSHGKMKRLVLFAKFSFPVMLLYLDNLLYLETHEGGQMALEQRVVVFIPEDRCRGRRKERP